MKIMVQLSGGRMGDHQFVAESEHAVSGWAHHLFQLCDQGTIGKKFSFVPPDDWAPTNQRRTDNGVDAGHRSTPLSYIVMSCVRLPTCVIVRAKHADAAYELSHC